MGQLMKIIKINIPSWSVDSELEIYKRYQGRSGILVKTIRWGATRQALVKLFPESFTDSSEDLLKIRYGCMGPLETREVPINWIVYD